MVKRNIKPLTSDEIKFLNEKYSFEILKNKIMVKPNGFNRTTVYEIDEGFRLNTKVRTVFIQPEAIKFWINDLKKDYSLFEVQNAISNLLVLNQDINLYNIKLVLERKSITIKIVDI